MQRHAPQTSSIARRVRTLAGALTVLLVGTAMYAQNVRAQTSTLPSTGVAAVTTYESAGLYWQSRRHRGLRVKYRKSGETA